MKKQPLPTGYVQVKDGIHDNYILFFKWITNSSINPKLTILDFKCIKELSLYFLEQSETPESAVETFKELLRNWKKYNTFTQSNVSLRFINSNINNIIKQYHDTKQIKFGSQKNRGGQDSESINLSDFIN